jgi:hypothetical protein
VIFGIYRFKLKGHLGLEYDYAIFFKLCPEIHFRCFNEEGQQINNVNFKHNDDADYLKIEENARNLSIMGMKPWIIYPCRVGRDYIYAFKFVDGQVRDSPDGEWSSDYLVRYGNPRKYFYKLDLTYRLNSRVAVEFSGLRFDDNFNLMLGDFVYDITRDPESRHRSLAFYDDYYHDDADLYLSLPCVDKSSSIKLGLQKNAKSVDSRVEKYEWDNVLVRILPMIPNKDKDKDEDEDGDFRLYDSGYIYIIWDNKIWRKIKVCSNSQFVDIDTTKTTEDKANKYHVNIDGELLSSGLHTYDEDFELYQGDKKIHCGKMPLDQAYRCFDLQEDEDIVVKFPDLEQTSKLEVIETLIGDNFDAEEGSNSLPARNIIVPYKIEGNQADCYVYHSEVELTEEDEERIAASPEDYGVSLADLSCYSSSKSFASTGDVISEVKEVGFRVVGQSIINSLIDVNIAAVNMGDVRQNPKLSYKIEPGLDFRDCFFEIRCKEHDWVGRSYMVDAKDKEGYKIFYFPTPPKCVETVDLYRFSISGSVGCSHQSVLVEKGMELSSFFA